MPEGKKLMLREMRACGALERTRRILVKLEWEIREQICTLESQTGVHNAFLELLVERLKV